MDVDIETIKNGYYDDLLKDGNWIIKNDSELQNFLED